MTTNQRFADGDKVRASEPDNPYYGCTGTVLGRVTDNITTNRPHTYYRVEVVVPPDGVTQWLCFRDHQLERV